MDKRRKLRIMAFSYDGGWGRFQLLQERRWWGWKTIDREEVPRWHIVNEGCFGRGTSEWRSKFLAHGTWGRDGMIQRYPERDINRPCFVDDGLRPLQSVDSVIPSYFSKYS